MIYLQLVNACKGFGDLEVLSDITWSIQKGERIGLVGANGTGKSTLLNLLAGAWAPDNGSVSRPADLRIGYLQQSARLGGSRTLYAQMQELFRDLPETEPYDYKIRRALSGVGLTEDQWQLPASALSGGEKSRAALARVLLAEPDLLLLDEPTNHLDLSGREWLEDYLKRFEGALVLVAHDRLLLNRVTNQTAFLIAHGLKLYNGSYSVSRDKYEKEKSLLTKAYRRQREEIARTEDFIRRNIAGQKTKQAQSRRRKLAKIERLELPEYERSAPKIGWQHAGRSRAELLRLESCRIGYGSTLVAELDTLVLRRGEKIGVVGPNGCGKSTLLRTLQGETKLLAGRLTQGDGTEISYFRQEIPHDHAELTVREHFWNCVPSWEERQVRSFLARFLFSQDEVEKTLGALSGGERRRLELARLTVSPAHLLVLDEPTNHLDISAQEAVEGALKDFAGALLLVSHDRFLLDAVCSKLWVFQDGKVREHLGTYSDLAAKAKLAFTDRAKKKRAGPTWIESARKKRAETERLQRRIGKAEETIHRLEAEIAQIDREGRDPATATNFARLNFLITEKRKKDRELSQAMHEWDEAQSRLRELVPDDDSSE